VREYARLQSFPDWFEFKGKYTTGGDRRVRECPRYTQVGNAVPPFLAECLGNLLKRLSRRHMRSGNAYGNKLSVPRSREELHA
jgi:DNA (cytosine-5)-methyltransferase 1